MVGFEILKGTIIFLYAEQIEVEDNYPVMRRSAGDMVLLDDRILEFLEEYGNHQPAQIADQLSEVGAGLEYHDKYVGRRCRALAEIGLTMNVGNGVYAITDEGRAYLDGEIDAETLSPDTDE